MSRYLVYLLCFDGPDAFPRHYVGITTPGRLRKRMMEHRAGKGGKLTQNAYQEGRSWALTRLWSTDQPEDERLHADNPHIERECPRCAHGLTGEPQLPYVRRKVTPEEQDLFSFDPK